MKRTNLLSFLLLLLLAQALFGQQVALLNTFHSSGTRASAAHAALETLDGHIALAGWQETEESASKQATLLLLSPKWALKAQHNFGGSGDDAANALVQTFDGAFVLAGHTDGRGKRKAAWLFKTDENSRVLWQWKDPDPAADSEWHDVAQLPDGSLVAVGEKNGQPCALRVSAEGREIARAQIEKVRAGAAYAIALGPRKRLGLTGAVKQSGGKQSVFFAEMDTLLRVVARDVDNSTVLPTMQGRSIAYDPAAKRYLIAAGGTPYEIGQTVFYSVKNAVLQIASEDKNQRNQNLVASATALPGGAWLLAGASTSRGKDNRGHDSFLPILLRTTADPKTANLGKELTKLGLPGVPGKTIPHASVLLHDGTLLLAGETDGRLWAVRDSLPGVRLPSTATGLSVSDVRFRDAGGNDTLNAWERGHVRFAVRNLGAAPVWGLRAKVEAKDNSWGLRYTRTVQLGHLPGGGGDTLTLSIPLAGESYLASGRCTLLVTLLDAAGRPLAPAFSQPFPTLEDPPPLLALSLERGLPDSILREEDVTVGIWVKNIGPGSIARNVQVDFNCPYLVETRYGTQQPVDTLRFGDSTLLRFSLNVGWLYMEDAVTVRLKAYEENNYYRSKCFNGIRFRVSSFFEIKPPGSPLIRMRDAERQLRGHGPSRPAGMGWWGKEEFQVLWSFLPDPESKRDSFLRDSLTGTKHSKIFFHDNQIILRAWVIPLSGRKYSPEFYRDTLRLSWQLQNSENRADRKKILPLLDSENPKNLSDTLLKGYYFFFRKTALKPGDNTFIITAAGSSSLKIKCPTFTVHYDQPKTYCFIFGIHYGDSTHTARNAEIVGKVMRAQARAGFVKTAPDGIHVWTEPDSTSAQGVIDLLRKYFQEGYKYNQRDEDNNAPKRYGIGPHDQIILYFSGHYNGDKPPFNILFPENTGKFVFQREVLNELSFGAFRRVFLYLDVCNSGRVVKHLQTPRHRLPAYQFPNYYLSGFDKNIIPDTTSCYVFASSGPYEFSAEKDTLGLWTQAFAEAFENKKVKVMDDKKMCADENGDGLSASELNLFLARRVPVLVEEYNEKYHAKHQQHPCATSTDGTRVGKVPKCH